MDTAWRRMRHEGAKCKYEDNITQQRHTCVTRPRRPPTRSVRPSLAPYAQRWRRNCRAARERGKGRARTENSCRRSPRRSTCSASPSA
eukprot:scaffold9894_cov118-Isochrysis_galbana.AAC.4